MDRCDVSCLLRRAAAAVPSLSRAPPCSRSFLPLAVRTARGRIAPERDRPELIGPVKERRFLTAS